MKSTSDLFNEMIPLGRLIRWLTKKIACSTLPLTHGYYRDQFRVLCSIRCEVCITPLS